MSKTSKRAILTIIVIATFLTVMIPIVPVMAITDPVYVVDHDTIPSFYVLVPSTGTAAWRTDEAYSGSDSVYLNTLTAGTPKVVIDMPEGTTLGDIESASWKYHLDSGYPPHLDIYLDHDDDGVVDDCLTFEYANNDLIKHGSVGQGTNYGAVISPDDTWYTTFSDDGDGPSEVDDDAIAWSHLGGNLDLHSLEDWKAGLPSGMSDTIDEDTTVLHLQFEADPGINTSDFYLDDIEINGVLLPLEEMGTQYDEELTVSGTGVTSGAVVDIFWDLVTPANVLGTTIAANDGTFEYEFDVPTDYGGYHYVWARDVGGVAMMFADPIFVVPMLDFSPSSGLPGDDITIKGYGFSADADVTITFPTHSNTNELSLDAGTDNTNDKGYFEYTFEIDEVPQETDYTVTAIDEYGYTVTGTFEVGASIQVTPTSGPSGMIIEVSGEGFAEDPAPIAIFTVKIIGDDVPDLDCYVIDKALMEVDSDEEITFEIVIPSVATADMEDYEEIEVNIGGKTVSTDFVVTGTTVMTIVPAFGVQGSTVSIDGYNFTAIDEEEVELVLLPEGGTSPGDDIAVDEFETDSDGEFSGYFIVPAVQSGLYTLIARQETYDIETIEDFNVGIMIVILNPSYGASGTKIYLTGTGFTTGEEWNATFGDIDILPTEDTSAVSVGTVSDEFFVPSVDVDTYTVTVMDIDRDITVTVDFNVIATTVLELDPAAAPNDYNITIEGSYFTAEAGTDLDFVLYNATEDWDPIDMEVLQGAPAGSAAETDEDGNFTAWWIVLDDETLSIGDYTINVTDENDLFAQIAFNIAEERVDVTPRKESFDIGDTVSFDVQNDFIFPDSYLKIWDPADNLYWVTEPIASEDWIKVEALYTVPYYKQTSGENPMLLSPDAPLDTWTWAFYNDKDDQIINGTFAVGRSSADVLGEQIEALGESLTEIVTSTTALAESVEAVSEASAEAAAAAATAAAAAADAKTAANAAATAVADVGDIATDALSAANDAASAAAAAKAAADSGLAAANDAKTTSQAAVDAANDAAEAAQGAKTATSGLTTLVYGAIGASLIAALAAIVSLMQISRRIAG